MEIGDWVAFATAHGGTLVRCPAMDRILSHLELAQRNVAEGEQNIARQREVIAELGLQTARELLQEMARYWQMRVEEIRILAGFAGITDDTEAAEIMLRIAGDYDRLVQKAADAERSS